MNGNNAEAWVGFERLLFGVSWDVELQLVLRSVLQFLSVALAWKLWRMVFIRLSNTWRNDKLQFSPNMWMFCQFQSKPFFITVYTLVLYRPSRPLLVETELQKLTASSYYFFILDLLVKRTVHPTQKKGKRKYVFLYTVFLDFCKFPHKNNPNIFGLEKITNMRFQ